MSQPEGPQFACIGCGAMNPVGAESCSGCGHRFAGPEVPPSRAEPAASPTTPARPRVVLEGGTPLYGGMVVVVALLAAEAAIFYLSASVGAALLVAAIAGAVWTAIFSSRRKAEGRPTSFGEKVGHFGMTLAASVLVVMASAIAFVVTCFPIGLAGMQGESAQGPLIYVAYAVGGVAALLAGGSVAFWINRISRSRKGKGGSRE